MNQARLLGLVVLVGAPVATTQGDAPPISTWLQAWQPEPGAWAIGDLTASGPGGVVYQVARIDEGDGDADLVLLKYEADGRLAWVTTYDGPGSGGEAPTDVAITPEGVSIVAASLGESQPQTVLLDYASDGTLRWEARTLGPEFPGFLRPRLAIGANGQRVIATDDGNGRGSLERYSAAGALIDAYPLTFSGFGGVSALAVDDDLNAILVVVNDFGRYDVLKIDPGGTLLWSYTENDNTGLVLSEAAIEIDAGGDAVIAGSPEVFCPGAGVAVTVLVWRLAPDGMLRWRRELAPEPCGFFILNDLALGPAGETYVAGNGVVGTASLVRVDADGAVAWTRTTADAGFSGSFGHVVVGTHGQVIVGAAESEPPTAFAVRALCYGADGTLGWTRRLAGTPDDRHLISDLAAGPDGSVSIAATALPEDGAWRAIAIGLDFAACLGDLDDDGEVGFSDVLRLLDAWGNGADDPADFDGDGVVGFGDLLTLLAGWGPCGGP